MRHKRTFAAAAILLCFLTGCGKENYPAGPVFGDTCKGYDGFTYLEEVALEHGRSSVTVFLPKGQELRTDRDSGGSSSDGVSVQIAMAGYAPCDTLPEKQCREWVLARCQADRTVYAAGFRICKAQYLENGAVRIPVSYYRIYEKKLKVDRTCYIRQLDQNTVFFLEVNVSRRDITERTAEILDEMEQFYQFEIACDRKYVQMVSELARERRREDPYLRIRKAQAKEADNIYRSLRLIAESGNQKEPVRLPAGERTGIVYIKDVKLMYGKHFFLAAMRIRKWGECWKYRICFSCEASGLWVVETGKESIF